jgi:hypothetical protein
MAKMVNEEEDLRNTRDTKRVEMLEKGGTVGVGLNEPISVVDGLIRLRLNRRCDWL